MPANAHIVELAAVVHNPNDSKKGNKMSLILTSSLREMNIFGDMKIYGYLFLEGGGGSLRNWTIFRCNFYAF